MSKNGKKLVNGVRELVRCEGVTFEDMHMVASDLLLYMDKRIERAIKKLKVGQRLRCYDESSGKEYGQRGSAFDCFFLESLPKTNQVRIYTKEEGDGVVGFFDILNILDYFDPESEEGRKQKQVILDNASKLQDEKDWEDPYEWEPTEQEHEESSEQQETLFDAYEQ